MHLIRLAVENFVCVRSAKVEFGPGLNVLYGPNDLGKSSLAEAIRAVLLMQHTSRGHEPYVQWRTDKAPSVELVFQTEPQRVWRLRKTFGTGAKGSSTLEFSRDGLSFTTEARGRRVDAEIRRLLKWGIPEPGGRGGQRGIHESFLTTVLLAHQADVTSVFRADLSGDDDKSGRDRLTQALQVIAQDPLFTRVLTATQGKYEEAFTNTGKKKRGRTSPFTEIAVEVRKALETEAALEASLATSDTARNHVARLADERLRHEARVAESKALLTKLTVTAQKQDERDNARHELQRIEELSRRVSEATEEEAGIEKDLADLGQKLDQANARAGETRSSHQEAERKVAEVTSASGEQKRKLELAELKNEQLTLEARRIKLSEQKAALAGIQNLVDKATDVEQRLLLETQALQKCRKELEETKRTVEDGTTNLKLLKAIGDWLEFEEVQSQLKDLEETIRRGEESRRQAEEKRKEADGLRAIDADRKLPADDALSRLEELQSQLRSAEASTGVGLSLVVTPERPFDARVSRDGKAAEKVSITKASDFNANREIQLEIQGLGKIAVTGGKADSRQRLSAMRDQWQKQALPILRVANAATLEELRQVSREHDRRQIAIQLLEQEVAALEAKVNAGDVTRRGTRAEELKSQLKALEQALSPFDREVLEERRASMGSSAKAELRKLIDINTQEIDRAKLTTTELEVQIARNETQHRVLTEEQAEAHSKRDVALGQFGAGWSNALQKAQSELTQIDADEHALQEKIHTLMERQTGQLHEAQARVAEAKHQQEEAEEHLKSVDQHMVKQKTALGACRGRLEERRRAAEQENEERTRVSLSTVEKEVEALESESRALGHTGPIDADAVEAADANVRREQSKLRQIERELNEAKGALSQTGGDVARERLETARERRKRLGARESELDTEYGAWKLLLDVLHQAEQDQTAHLGESMVTPISQRFQEFTRERYGQFELGPNLETDGIEAAGNKRDVATLSVGTQEQLATIFRLSLAEQLKSVLVLDDQLAQTDAVRMNWFRRKLKESAENIQIVVFTCRPEDYLDEAERRGAGDSAADGSRTCVVDLAQVLERAGGPE